MKKVILPLLAIIVLLLMIAWMAGLFNEKIQPGSTDTRQTDGGEAVAVKVAEVAVIEKVPASVEATQATLVSSRLLARIVAVRVRAGDSVQKGDLLLELENSDIKARVQQADAQIQGVNARLNEAVQNLDRVRKLRADGVMSVSDLDRAEAAHASLESELAAANEVLEEARTALSYTLIKAPFAGRVVDRFAEPGDTAQPGTTLLALYNPLNLRVEAQVREGLALKLEVGQALQVEIPSLEKTVDAVIEERVPVANPGSRSFLVKAGVVFDSHLLPGMYARLLVPAGSGKQMTIPADRVVHVGQLDLVWVLKEGRSERRFVRIGQLSGDGQVEVLSGLVDGELVLPLP